MTGPVRFRVLGPFDVQLNGEPIIVRGRQRVVLATLVLFANRPVPHELLASYAWQENPPRQIRASLQTVVTRLRRQLGATTISTTEQGYRLCGDQHTIDLLRFRALVAKAARVREADDIENEYALLSEATALWGGDPLADVPSDRLRTEAVPRLQDDWFRAVERRLTIDLEYDRHRDVLGELRSLTATYPFRENLWHMLIRALHHSGRRAEALEAYRTAASALRDQLGLDPGRELARLQQAVLADERGDTGSGVPAKSAAPTTSRPAATGPAANTQNTNNQNTNNQSVGGQGAAPSVTSDSTAANPGSDKAPDKALDNASAIPRPVRELPADIAGFVGRSAALSALDALLPHRSTADRVVIATIDGTAGIGKTALAVHWAHRASEHFPDGQLYVNLRGFGPGRPVDPADALTRMLRSLDVPAGQIPARLEARSALLRSHLADRRMLILLDNAADSAQVRPLLPGTAAAVVVTSRNQLRSLSTREGARRITLDELTKPDALALVAGIAGDGRVTAEPNAAAELSELCARLPLAIRLAAENIARGDRTMAGLVAELRDKRARLDALSADDDPATDLRAVFSWSYDVLSDRAARMFRLLGLHPDGDFTAAVAAAVAGVNEREAAGGLDELLASHLIDNHRPGRFQFHDLLREYAHEVAGAAPASERGAAIDRLVSWYLHTSANARERLSDYPHRMLLPTRPDGVRPLEFPDYASAANWYEAEYGTMATIIRLAAHFGYDGAAAKIAQFSWMHLYNRGDWPRMCELGELAAASARRHGDDFLEGKCLNGLAAPYRALGRGDEAVASCELALAIFERLDEPMEQVTALTNIGVSHNSREQFEEALVSLRRAATITQNHDFPIAEAVALNNMAQSHLGLGRPREASPFARRAVEIFERVDDPMRLTAALDTLAAVYAASDEHELAVTTYRRALELADDARFPRLAVLIQVNLGHEMARLGDTDAARELWERARVTSARLGDAQADELRDLLARTNPADGTR